MLTDKQLQQIRERTALLQRSGVLDTVRAFDPVATAARDDLPAVLAEVERLQKRLRDTIKSRESFIRHATLAAKERYEKAEVENAAMCEIVQAVAAADPVSDVAREWSKTPGWLSVAIDRVWVTKARAILAEQSASHDR